MKRPQAERHRGISQCRSLAYTEALSHSLTSPDGIVVTRLHGKEQSPVQFWVRAPKRFKTMFTAVKRHKKLCIVDENGTVVYWPPNFLKPQKDRSAISQLADRFNAVGYRDIAAIIEFEAAHNPR